MMATTSDRAGGGTDVTGAESAEGAHHARDGAEKTEERGGGDARIEGRHALLEAGELLT
jgi:hypothetical protein